MKESDEIAKVMKLRTEYQQKIGESELLKDYQQLMAERKTNDLKGGMMVLGGLSTFLLGGASLWGAEFCMDQYQQANSTADALHWRKLTNTCDALSGILMVAGAIISSSSAAYFCQGKNASDLALMGVMDARKEKIVLLR